MMKAIFLLFILTVSSALGADTNVPSVNTTNAASNVGASKGEPTKQEVLALMKLYVTELKSFKESLCNKTKERKVGITSQLLDFSYDVQTTTSLVSPYFAIVETLEETKYLDDNGSVGLDSVIRYRATLAFQNNDPGKPVRGWWELKSVERKQVKLEINGRDEEPKGNWEPAPKDDFDVFDLFTSKTFVY